MFWQTENKEVAYIDSDKCNGCERCVKMCRYRVLEMVIAEGEKRAIANRTDRCCGCGRCIVICPQRAIGLKTII
jgi:heterodisulfide reductase subunit A-like polyferredoxin